MKRVLPAIAMFVALGCQASEAQRASRSPGQAAADQILRQDLLEDALPRIDKSAIEYHANRSTESLDVSIAAILVGAYRRMRGNEYHLGTLRSGAELANVNYRIAMTAITGNITDPVYVANVAKVGSLHQDAANDPKSLQAQMETKWNDAFTAEDATEIIQLLPLLKSASDMAAFAKARTVIQQELERSADLLKPFANAKPISADVAMSRQRIAALITEARRAGAK